MDLIASGIDKDTSADATYGEGGKGEDRGRNEFGQKRVAACVDLGDSKSAITTLTRWEKRREKDKTSSLIQDEDGNDVVTRGNSKDNAGIEPMEGLETTKRAFTKPGGRTLMQRRNGSLELPLVPVQAAGIRESSADRSPRLADSKPRARAVRFLLDGKREEKNGESAGNDRFRPTERAVDGSSQKTQRQAEAFGSQVVAHQNVEVGSDEVHDRSFWTCVVCCQRNDDVGGAEDCTTCGRRQLRSGSQDHDDRAGLLSTPANNRNAGSSTLFEVPSDRLSEEGGSGGHQNVNKSFTDYRAISAGSRQRVKDACDTTKNTAGQSERRGPYDLSSFVKMKEATQPVVKARLGLTREIQSLLSAIRR